MAAAAAARETGRAARRSKSERSEGKRESGMRRRGSDLIGLQLWGEPSAREAERVPPLASESFSLFQLFAPVLEL